MAARKQVPWPFGLKTETCSACAGSGLSRTSLASATASRHPSETHQSTLRCGTCSGRGRIINDPDTVECKHHLPRRDCALCRREARA